ncbi:MAG: PCP reductase family protein [Gemmatimonadetes bacterium]|nr:PCP reductase family protein [Gemmatimonadota bacterium]
MKFVCRTCGAFMLFQEVEPIREESLGVTFGCPQCGNRISMVTNPGETQLVHALGVKLGGRAEAHQPLELTRETLQSSSSKGGTGQCPFSDVVAEMQGTLTESEAATVEWTPEARARLERVPDLVRSLAKTAIEQIALQKGSRRVDERLMDEAKDRFMR